MFDTTYDPTDLWGWDGEIDEDSDAISTGLGGGWQTYTRYGGFVSSLDTERALHAHKMLKSFVDTFSRPGERYTVGFGGTGAWSDRESKRVQITSEPLYDTNLDNAEAAAVLVGFACHEASHSRYGAEHEQRVRRSFGKTARSAHALSNLLDDVYIERSFVAEYPGYAGVFDQTTRWVERLHDSTDPSGSPVMVAVRAVRYAAKYDWSDPALAAELAWWTAWAAQYATADPDAHVEGVKVGLDHINEQKQAQAEQKAQQPQGELGEQDAEQDGDGGQAAPGEQPEGEQPQADDGTGEGQQADEQAADDGTGDEADGEQADDSDAHADSQGAEQDAQDGKAANAKRAAAEKADEGVSDADLDAAVKMSETGTAGTSKTGEAAELNDAQTEQALAELETLEATGVDGELVEHVRNPRTLKREQGYEPVIDPSGSAAAAIRNAFARSRGGHTDTTKGTTRGRCDNGSLHRIASNDSRLFHRRSSPSPDNWVVWVMIDWSGSMSHQRNDTLSVARALASASRSVPQMRLAVKTWTSPQQAQHASAGVVDLWESGQSVERLADARHIGMGSTPDSTAMNWAVRAINRERRGSERALIVFASDGEGDAYGMKQAVEAGRKAGIEILSVALGGLSTQQETYGERDSIPWTGNVSRTAGPLARALTRIMK